MRNTVTVLVKDHYGKFIPKEIEVLESFTVPHLPDREFCIHYPAFSTFEWNDTDEDEAYSVTERESGAAVVNTIHGGMYDVKHEAIKKLCTVTRAQFDQMIEKLKVYKPA